MKKLLLVLAFCILLTNTVVAYADIDQNLIQSVDALDNDTMLELRDYLNQSLLDRGVEVDSDFPEGVYTVGKDLKSGTYTFEFTDMEVGALIYVYNSIEDYNNENSSYSNTIVESTGTVSISLEDGNILYLKLVSSSGKIRINSTKPAWAP